MSGGIHLRTATAADIDGVLGLWRAADAQPTVTDDAESLRQLVEGDPRSLIVAVCGCEVVGSVIGAWDGWRGSIYRLAVHPQHRRRGVGTRLVVEAERRLRERGAQRITAIVAMDETHALGFWNAVGYEPQGDRLRFVHNVAPTPKPAPRRSHSHEDEVPRGAHLW